MASEEKIDYDKKSEPGQKGYEDWMNFNVASRLPRSTSTPCNDRSYVARHSVC